MMGLQEIKRMNKEAAKVARKEKIMPYLVKKEDMPLMPPFPFPYIGDYRPAGYRLINQYFCDSSGFGQDDEPALSINQFMGKIKVGHAYALIECGQFQAYVGEFVKREGLRKAA